MKTSFLSVALFRTQVRGIRRYSFFARARANRDKTMLPTGGIVVSAHDESAVVDYEGSGITDASGIIDCHVGELKPMQDKAGNIVDSGENAIFRDFACRTIQCSREVNRLKPFRARPCKSVNESRRVGVVPSNHLSRIGNDLRGKINKSGKSHQEIG
jgi:hypothetical protein